VCGAIYNAIAHTPRNANEVIEVKTLADIHQEIERNRIEEDQQDGVIRAPKRKMPAELEEYLSRLKVL
jgi:hypothetical protein